jgi:hypothetical protein
MRLVAIQQCGWWLVAVKMQVPIARAMETVHLPASVEQKPAESSADSVAGEIDFKQAQTQLISSLEQFIKSAESVQTTTSLATNLLNVLKGLK